MLLTYSSVTPQEILKITFIQFKILFEEVSSKIAWQVKLARLPHVSIREKDFPIFEEVNADFDRDHRKLTLNEAKALKSFSKEQ